jgi:hypothetical protein
MTAYDWIMALVLAVIASIAAIGFWRSRKVELIEQPDNWPQYGGHNAPPPGGHP